MRIRVITYWLVLISILAYWVGVALQYKADSSCMRQNIPHAKIVWFDGIYCVVGKGFLTPMGEFYFMEKAIPLEELE